MTAAPTRSTGRRVATPAPTPTAAGAPPRPRPTWVGVAVPTEHGGWGLTAEPVLLGLLLRPSGAGVLLGLAALVAFVLRSPLKVVLVDLFRRRWLPRSRVALAIAGLEAAVLIALAVGAWAWADGSWLWPLLIAAPLVVLELWFDMRSRGRRLVPELAGAVGIGAVAAAVVLAGGGPTGLAVGAWAVLAGRAVTSIPFVRVQITRLRTGAGSVVQSDIAQAVGVALAAAAVVGDRALLAGAAAVAAIAVVQGVAVRRPPVPAKVLGLRQMALGLGLVVVTAVGVWVA